MPQADSPDLAPGERVRSLAPMLADSDVRVRKSAVIALGRIGCPESAEMLCGALGDAEEGVRVLVCQALGRLADPACVPALLEHAHDPSREVRSGVLWVFANIAAHGGEAGGAAPEAVRSALFTPVVVLAFDPDDGVRADAAAVLGSLRDPRAADPLLVLVEDACPRVRANACASLGLLDDQAGLEALLSCAEDEEEDALVAVSALDGLARRAERGSLAAGNACAGRALCAACRRAAACPAEVPAAASMPSADSASVAPASPGAADAPTQADVRATALWALGMLPIPGEGERSQVREVLAAALADGDVWSRRYAVEALVRIGGEDARAVLQEARERHRAGECALEPEVVEMIDRALQVAEAPLP